MTAEEIVARLLNDPDKGITPDRLRKLRSLAKRSNVPIEDVLRAMPPAVIEALKTP